MTLAVKSTNSKLIIFLIHQITASRHIIGDESKMLFPLIKSLELNQKSFVLKGFGIMTGKLRSDNGNRDTMDHSNRIGTGMDIRKMKLKSPNQMTLPQDLNIYRDYLSKCLFLRRFLINHISIYSLVKKKEI
jgi:hypothetical protein